MSSGSHLCLHLCLPVMLQTALLMRDLSYQLLSLWVCNGQNPFSSLLPVSQAERIGATPIHAASAPSYYLITLKEVSEERGPVSMEEYLRRYREASTGESI